MSQIIASRCTSTYREEIRTARKERYCEDYLCQEPIRPGERYLIATEYPGGESGYADAAGHPVRLLLCRSCAVRSFEEAARINFVSSSCSTSSRKGGVDG